MDREIGLRMATAREEFTENLERRFDDITKELADDIDKIETQQSHLRLDGNTFQDRVKEAILTLEQQLNNLWQ